jgi:hypothetical protein
MKSVTTLMTSHPCWYWQIQTPVAGEDDVGTPKKGTSKSLRSLIAATHI